MNRALIARVAQAPIVLFGVSLLVFLIMRVLPGDVVDSITEGSAISPQQRAEIEHRIGLDKSLPLQYLDWMVDLVRFDFGESLTTRGSIADDVTTRLPRTLELSVLALAISTLLGVATGVTAAVRRGGISDYALRLLSLSGLAVPLFFLQSVVRNYLLPKYTGWLPPAVYEDPWDDLGTNFQQMWLPALLLGLAMSAYTTRLTRSAMLDVLTQDYIRTARAKGLRQRTVILRHAFRNALLPVLTLSSIQLGALLGGAVITERIFALPGMGTYMVDAIIARDYPIVQAVVVISASMYIILNLSVDLISTRLDPRLGEG